VHRFAGRSRLDVAVNLAAAFDLDPTIADRPRDPARCLNHQAAAHHEAAFEAAPHFGLVNCHRTLEEPAFGNFDNTAVREIRFDTAFDIPSVPAMTDFPQYLVAARWPDGFVCPRCGGGKAWRLETKAWTYECASCGRQTSVTAGTIMHHSKLPLTAWFWAAYLMATHSNGISALQLQRQLAFGSYKTAWLICAKPIAGAPHMQHSAPCSASPPRSRPVPTRS